MDGLEPVNADLIREMRKEGRHLEAQELLNTYHRHARRQRAQERKEVISVTKKKEYVIAKNIGVCTYISCCEPALDGKTLCEEHLMKQRVRNKK